MSTEVTECTRSTNNRKSDRIEGIAYMHCDQMERRIGKETEREREEGVSDCDP